MKDCIKFNFPLEGSGRTATAFKETVSHHPNKGSKARKLGMKPYSRLNNQCSSNGLSGLLRLMNYWDTALKPINDTVDLG
ncbi:hypothetical protein PCASD_24530 [Puccinia coronata f. sp. avenae]|uniref:Uncharacterized protein n=1 Tax=Puccinia coronata f. sp. avenae TaxID=200324 RepID=A0A2N5S4J8_9BASI|nr:hypothetical protein PCASD_24530 [Puccinia coronata f. sp. avenae]